MKRFTPIPLLVALMSSLAFGQVATPGNTGKFYGKPVQVIMPTGFDLYPVFTYHNGTTLKFQVNYDGSITCTTVNGINLATLQSDVAGKASLTHASTHAAAGADAVTLSTSQITGLDTALSGKASTTHASTHGTGQSDAITVAQSQVTGLTTDLSQMSGDLALRATSTNPYLSGIVTLDGSIMATKGDNGHLEINKGLDIVDTNLEDSVPSLSIIKSFDSNSYRVDVFFSYEFGLVWQITAPTSPAWEMPNMLSILGNLFASEGISVGMGASGKVWYDDSCPLYDDGDNTRAALMLENTDQVSDCDVAIKTQRYILVNGPIMPGKGLAIDLGDATHKFQNIYQSGASYQGNTATSTASYNVASTDSRVYVTASTGNNKVVNLPAATGSGRILIVKKVDNSAATVTVTADTTGTPDTIDGAATRVLSSQWQVVTIQDAAENVWYVN